MEFQISLLNNIKQVLVEFLNKILIFKCSTCVFLGVFSTIHQVVVKEGFLGLYKGNGVQMLRIFPYAAIQFMSYEQYKKVKHSD